MEIEVTDPLLVSELEKQLRDQIADIFEDHPISDEIAPNDAKFCFIKIDGIKSYGITYSICDDIFHIHNQFRIGNKPRKFFDFALDVVNRIAKKNGCDRIIFHTIKPGMLKEAKKQGFKIADVRLERQIQ